jgi:hypothetical protein
MHHRAFIGALILDRADFIVAADQALRRNRTMNHKRLFTMENLEPIDTQFRPVNPESGMRENVADRRHGLEAGLIEKLQLPCVLRPVAIAHAKGIQDAIARSVAMLDRRQTEVCDGLDVHCFHP